MINVLIGDLDWMFFIEQGCVGYYFVVILVDGQCIGGYFFLIVDDF